MQTISLTINGDDEMALSANLNEDLANINQWQEENILALNVDKTSLLALRSKQKLVTEIGNKEEKRMRFSRLFWFFTMRKTIFLLVTLNPLKNCNYDAKSMIQYNILVYDNTSLSKLTSRFSFTAKKLSS